MQVDTVVHSIIPGLGRWKQKGQEFRVIFRHIVSPRTAGLTREQKQQQKPKLRSCRVQWLHVLLVGEFLCNHAFKCKEKHGHISILTNNVLVHSNSRGLCFLAGKG